MPYPPHHFSEDERIAMAMRCRDADCIPKVVDAGKLFVKADGERLQVMHNGLKVVAGGYYGDWMTNLIRQCRGHHEVQEERIFYEVEKRLPNNANMIELGAYWAYYSLWFLQDQPERRAIAIEPEPLHLDIGRRNAGLNNLPLTILPSFAGAEYAPSLPFPTEKSGTMVLPCYSVAKLMEMHDMQHLHLLHCDIQGAETEVLHSCRPLFEQGRIGWTFVSTHAHQISGDPLTHQHCLDILRQSGATIEAEHDAHESFSGDGLIVARFCPAPIGWRPVELSFNRQSESLFRHLAYDLSQSRDEIEALRALVAQSPSPHDSLQRRGSLFQIDGDGPLGRPGDMLLIPDDKVMAPHIVSHASWAIKEVDAILSKLSPDEQYALVDIGANIGMMSRQILNATPNVVQCLCVEPDPNNFAALSYNLAHFSNRTTLFNHALGATNERQRFYYDTENIGNFSLNWDAMRARPHLFGEVDVRATAEWMAENLTDTLPIIWKSDTQGWDELIVSLVPWDKWRRIAVAQMELWRIVKPDFDRDAFYARIEDFPHRRLGNRADVASKEIEEYLAGDDWAFQDLLLWR